MQTLPASEWELIIVDNASDRALGSKLDLSWQAAARVVAEPQLGLVFARVCGFRNARANLIVNLDDDSVLIPAFLSNAIALAKAYPHIGVFGSQLRPEFESTPSRPASYYYAAERHVDADTWSNLRDNWETTPAGSGSVIRRGVINRYLQRIEHDPRLLELGRRGSALLSCEDIDIANSAIDLGLGKGIFKDLQLTHLIPTRKMSDEFKITNAYWNQYSAVIHNFLQYGGRLPAPRSWQNRLQLYLRSLFRDQVSRRIMLDQVRAERDAVREMRRRRWL